jgi:hypothetical protein
MQNIIILLIAVSAVGFISAVIASLLGGEFLTVSAEAFSRVCNNLALIAIALILWLQNKK